MHYVWFQFCRLWVAVSRPATADLTLLRRCAPAVQAGKGLETRRVNFLFRSDGRAGRGRENQMKKRTVNWHVVTVGATAVAIALSYGSNALAQTGGEQAQQARIAELKGKIANLQDQLNRAESERRNSAAATNGGAAKNPGDCCASGAPDKTSSANGKHDHPAGEVAQAGGGEPSPSGEHTMGGGMGGMEGEMGGASASPQASPGMPMQEHMKGMEHMHGMMHGGEASPNASPSGMPMKHGMPMEHGMGRMGGGAQPEASPSTGMGGMKDEM